MSSSRYKTVVVQLALVVHVGTLWVSRRVAFVVILFFGHWREASWLGRCIGYLLAVQAGGTQQFSLVAPVGRHGSFNAHVAAMAEEQRHRLRATQVF